jgi:hypothetical protein
MLYVNFGHNAMDYSTNSTKSSTFGSEVQNRFIIDDLLWLGGGTTATPVSPSAIGKPYKGFNRKLQSIPVMDLYPLLWFLYPV